MQLDAALLPADLDPETLPTRAVVVFDVLRATTTMTAALAAGVRAIHLCPDVPAARLKAADLGQDHRPLLCGEEKCLAPQGFDLGNSPGAFGPDHLGRTLVMSTTNGTRALIAARDAKLLLVGALVNASAVAQVLHQSGLAVTLLCAGTNGKLAIEDVLGAGAVIASLRRLTEVNLTNDAALVAAELFEAKRSDLKTPLANGAGGRNVLNAGLAPDIEFAARLDAFEAVGVATGSVVRKW